MRRSCAWQVGLLDIDICGPSVPKLVGLEGKEIYRDNHIWSCKSAMTHQQCLSSACPGCHETPLRALQVGLLDIDICGPSVPKLVGLEGLEIHRDNHFWCYEVAMTHWQCLCMYWGS